MSKPVEIVSQGGVETLTEAQLDEIRKSGVGWFAYCQVRLTLGHKDAIEHLQRNRVSDYKAVAA